MMRSMFSGVSSLKAHQLRMDVIGNNIANVNTVGYKSSAVSFSEMYSQTLAGASSSSQSRGGTNPMQVGLGTNTAAIAVNHTKGSIQRTDVATDLMVDGEGFFMVSPARNGENIMYTRAGNFSMDSSGYLVTVEGYYVLDKDFEPIQVNMSETVNASATSKLLVSGNINYNDKEYGVTVDAYDSLGDTHTFDIKFLEDPITTATSADLTADNAVSVRKMTITMQRESGDLRVFPGGTDAIADDGDGLGEYIGDSAETFYVGFDENGNVVGLYDSAYATLTDERNIPIPGAAALNIPLNKSMFYLNGDDTSPNAQTSFSQYAQDSDARGIQMDGFSAGSISSFNISSKGEVISYYTNGNTNMYEEEDDKKPQIIGLVSFDNPGGLMKMGSNMFQATPNSGSPKYGIPASGSFGSLTPGALEMSNVDLSAQFTDMITTQRGFQANSRVITTSDEILQELVNLKR
ncbi:flagellar hook protein FlgE [Fusibacter tunisiensis]|uniref:Flagellar hook protein FlgE n=1 Tax=Fusibacter tunisiensis TaxID=1008308 RepID=A0ABS2MMG1_9FIRM|nr:flagellar hook protein FlgE [Fusibacter tunisiensis]MBM7560589.1 flagellar hook protein FlgE [Fusibacter tunisiensis]